MAKQIKMKDCGLSTGERVNIARRIGDVISYRVELMETVMKLYNNTEIFKRDCKDPLLGIMTDPIDVKEFNVFDYARIGLVYRRNQAVDQYLNPNLLLILEADILTGDNKEKYFANPHVTFANVEGGIFNKDLISLSPSDHFSHIILGDMLVKDVEENEPHKEETEVEENKDDNELSNELYNSFNKGGMK